MKQKGSRRRQFYIAMLFVFLFLASMSIYNMVTYYRSSVAYVEALGESSLDYESAKIESYVQKGRDVLCVTADAYDAMASTREFSKVPIVFITADKRIEMIQKATEIGADDYVTKPFLPIALKERIHGVIYSI